MTALSTSLAATNSSIRTLLSCSKARFTPAISSSLLCALLIPTDEPAFEGFIKQGKPSFSSTFFIQLSFEISEVLTVIQSAWGIPASLNRILATHLSIHTALPRTPEPTYGMPAISNSPCIVPSSPFLPWRTGIITSVFIFSMSPLFLNLKSPLSPRDGEMMALSYSPAGRVDISDVGLSK